MTKGWAFGPTQEFWMEDEVNGNAYSFLIDFHEEVNFGKEPHDLLLLLAALEVIEYDCFYESIYQIRIRE